MIIGNTMGNTLKSVVSWYATILNSTYKPLRLFDQYEYVIDKMFTSTWGPMLNQPVFNSGGSWESTSTVPRHRHRPAVPPLTTTTTHSTFYHHHPRLVGRLSFCCHSATESHSRMSVGR